MTEVKHVVSVNVRTFGFTQDKETSVLGEKPVCSTRPHIYQH